MFINKMGHQHLLFGENCQDFGIVNPNLKLVCDGCSEGKHSEVGAKSFCHLILCGYNVEQAFEKLTELFGQNASAIKNYLCFTILMVFSWEDRFELSSCGDGYVILQDRQGTITFLELNDGEYPKYYAYNYVPSDLLKYYKDGVSISRKSFLKENYIRIGIASDGLRFILNAEETLKNEFLAALKSDKEVNVKRFINKNQELFKDDITIAF